MKLYKVLDKDSSARMGNGKWFLPKGGPGKWMPKIKGELVACKNGYHLCRRKDLVEWLGPRIFEAEYRGEILRCNDKVVVREARLIRELPWGDKKARLFAADCAERVLHIFEEKYPNDKSPREAIKAARAFARGEIGEKELEAAWDAAEAVAWDAARDVAWAAARAAAGDAAWNAAWAAADAERKWQTKKLFEYLK